MHSQTATRQSLARRHNHPRSGRWHCPWRRYSVASARLQPEHSAYGSCGGEKPQKARTQAQSRWAGCVERARSPGCWAAGVERAGQPSSGAGLVSRSRRGGTPRCLGLHRGWAAAGRGGSGLGAARRETGRHWGRTRHDCSRPAPTLRQSIKFKA